MWLNFFCKTCKGNRNGILQNWILKPRFDVMFSRKQPEKIMPNVLHNIGNTPLVKINKINQTAGLKCELCKF